jgi:hypothetical protein
VAAAGGAGGRSLHCRRLRGRGRPRCADPVHNGGGTAGTLAATARAGGPLVGVVSSDNLATELARLDPRTLRPLPGGQLKLAGTWPMLAVAPDRSVAVLGPEEGNLAVVDLLHLRRLGAIQTDAPSMVASGWNWVGRSNLLLIDTSQPAATEVLAVDVSTRRVVRRQRFNGVVQAYARLPRGWPCSSPQRTRSGGRGWWCRMPTPVCAR